MKCSIMHYSRAQKNVSHLVPFHFVQRPFASDIPFTFRCRSVRSVRFVPFRSVLWAVS